MPERMDRGLQPHFGSGSGHEGAGEREYQVKFSNNDWAVINYLALDRIEQRAHFIEQHENDPSPQSIAQVLEQHQNEAFMLNDMLTRWEEGGAPVVAKRDKVDRLQLDPALPQSWVLGLGTHDRKDYPSDGSLGVLQQVREGIGEAQPNEVTDWHIRAQTEDWQWVRSLLNDAKAVKREAISGQANETYVDLGRFGKSYSEAALQKKSGGIPTDSRERFTVISPDAQDRESITDDAALELVNQRLEQIESRLPA